MLGIDSPHVPVEGSSLMYKTILPLAQFDNDDE